ncbi:hypothetical protein CEXT_116561 [Caerostris extrusa]|uniref:Uncharacterized protein n=1 Tax=Caerostris extrusa TaxID=172846 RepID=A0AAV4W132_CAEEX|nr:hypothetical protein CEXT_116561 [Caerostris extrusa]
MKKNFFKNLEKERLDNFNIEGDESIAAKVPFEKEIKNRKQHDEWEEQEIMELRDIFLENQGEDDIMSIILNSLTRKRSKKSVIGKLIEVGLIKDKKKFRRSTLIYQFMMKELLKVTKFLKVKIYL